MKTTEAGRPHVSPGATSSGAAYTEYHPRWYRPRVSTYWWLGQWSSLKFILREISSVFVAWFVVYLLLLVNAAGSGRAAYDRFLSWSAGPWVLTLNLIALLFVLLHAVTWFNLAPKAMVVQVRDWRVPPVLVLALHFVVWALLTAFVAWMVLR